MLAMPSWFYSRSSTQAGEVAGLLLEKLQTHHEVQPPLESVARMYCEPLPAQLKEMLFTLFTIAYQR